MSYTVKKLAGISGVTARTLRFYDEADLLKPAYHGVNGYRYYEEPQLLMLQQILFYRELGFELKKIKEILQRSDFDKVAALESHRKVLRKNLAKTKALIVTIEKTIEHLKGEKKMRSKELFVGFSPEQQAKYESDLIERFGDCSKEAIAKSKQKVRNWTKGDWGKSKADFDGICRDMVKILERDLPIDSSEAQAAVRRHYKWLKQFWTPERKSYIGYAELVLNSELRKPYEACDPRLPEFAAMAMKLFAETELP